ncbi:MAG: phosphoribosylglycinamide formyltransferase [Lachnospiraceae bacterium]|nr:phosphoribosylglycinamide formyltransferase [Lachnospiraceae bacterium]
MLRLAVLVSGGGTNLQALIDQIEQRKLPEAEIAAVISSKKDAYALERARNHGIKVIVVSPKEYADPGQFAQALSEALEQNNIDLIILAGYLYILPESLVEKYKNRIINVHPSLIPAFCGEGYYGLKVHRAVLDRGVKVTGATVHFVDEGTDTGPIILQKAVAVQEGDTPELLQRRVMEEAEWILLPEAVRLISEGKVTVEKNIVRIEK